MNILSRPRNLADYPEDWWGWVARIAPTIVLVSFLGILPSSLLVLTSLNGFEQLFQKWMDVELSSGTLEFNDDLLWSYLNPFFSFIGQVILIGILAYLGSIYSSVSIQNRMRHDSDFSQSSLVKSLTAVFPRTYFHALIAGLIQFVIISILSIGLSIVLGILGIVFSVVIFVFKSEQLMFLPVVVLYLLFVLSLLIAIHFLSLAQAAVVDGKRPWDAIQYSIDLVKKFFWRILGLRVLSNLVINVIVGVVLFFPIFLVVAPYYQELFSMTNARQSESLELFAKFFEVVPLQLFVINILTSVVFQFFYPVVDMLIYHDVKARSEASIKNNSDIL